MIKLVSLDVDGTLLDREGLLPPRNRIAIKAAAAQGVHVILNTGKPLHAVTHLAGEIDYRDPIIAVGGALIVSRNGEGDWTALKRTALPEQTLKAFLPIVADTALSVTLVSTWRTYLYYGEQRDASLYDSMLYWIKINSLEEHTLLDRNSLLELKGMDLPILNLILHSEETDCQELARVYDQFAEIIPPEVMMNYSNEGTLNIAPARAGKLPAMEFLCEKLGVDRSEVMALGDYDSDLEVVNWAGLGAIMANAPLEVQDKAPMIAPSNETAAWRK
jgi:HAD-superfamily hydrolase, subfamily IIB